ncbi:metallophosphoesterase family protein [Halomonas sp. GXIMD04776]|uniref:metallophosphoesterase family protein n=1 Tax=Halomonas sp. GXIMD04776 TaxID=3415605 RepID=UPI003CBB2707
MTKCSSRRFKIVGGVTAILVLAGLITIQATHGQIFSMVASWLAVESRQIGAASADSGDQVVTARNDAGDKDSVLLAAGDIARCQPQEGFDKTIRNLEYTFGNAAAEPLKDAGANQTAELVDDYPGVPVLALGDLAYPDGAPADFRLCYDTYWGHFKDRTYPTPGNHEYHSLNAYAYYDYWGVQAGPERRGYYAKRMNDWLLLSLNSEVSADEDSDQARWLEAQLTNSDASCVLAFFHKPAFSTKERDDSEDARRLFDLLYRQRATLVLNGHNHFYERTRPLDAQGQVDPDDGIVTFVVGTGGTPTDDSREPAAFSERLIGDTYGMLKLTLSENEYNWQFLSAQTGNALDSGKGACNPRL